MSLFIPHHCTLFSIVFIVNCNVFFSYLHSSTHWCIISSTSDIKVQHELLYSGYYSLHLQYCGGHISFIRSQASKWNRPHLDNGDHTLAEQRFPYARWDYAAHCLLIVTAVLMIFWHIAPPRLFVEWSRDHWVTCLLSLLSLLCILQCHSCLLRPSP